MSVFNLSALFRKKIPNPHETSTQLAKCLSAWDLTLLGIGAIIGTGIFVLTGHAAAEQSGPAVVLSFVISGLACAFAALAYAELAAAVGGCGSAYGYSYAAFGELIAWIIGWDLLLEYAVATAAVANGWAGHLKEGLIALGYPLPELITKGPFATKTVPLDGLGMCNNIVNNTCVLNDPGIVNLPAVLIILILMGLLIVGVKESAKLNAAMVFIKLLTIAVFVVVASGHLDTNLWHPFMPFGWFDTTADGKTIGVLAGASVVFFAYVGFDAVSTAVEESKNPQRDVPIGILSSLVFCTVIYIIVSGLLTGVVSYKDLGGDAPVAEALEKLGIHWASALVATGVIAGLTTVMLVLYYGLTRILFAMSRDGLVPAVFSEVSEKRHTPVKATVICGVIMAITAGFLPLGYLAELVNIGTLAAFVLVCGGVIFLRIKQPNLPRPFKAPGGMLMPILGVFSCAALIAFLPWQTHMRFVLWLAAGIVIYFLYSAKRSHLAK